MRPGLSDSSDSAAFAPASTTSLAGERRAAGITCASVVGVELHMHPDVGVCSSGYDDLIAVSSAPPATRARGAAGAGLVEWTRWGTTPRGRLRSPRHVCGSPARYGRPREHRRPRCVRSVHPDDGELTEPVASPQDDSRKRSIVIRDTTRLPDPRKATMLCLGSNRGAEHRLGVPPVTIQHVR